MPIRAPTAPDERAARRSLLDQVARLESELAGLCTSAWPPKKLEFGVPSAGGGPRLLSLGKLEEVRDRLAGRVRDDRRALAERTYAEEQSRRLIEEMLLEPEKHK